MKQTTKVLLPLGLFMSIVIPITVKSLFTDTDFFESSESSKIDYLRPYKPKPEMVTDLPQLNAGKDGALKVIQQPNPEERYPSQNRQQSDGSERESRKRKLNMPSSLSPASEQESIIELSIGR